MMTALVAVASLSVTGYACVLAVHRQHVRAADSRRVVSGISAVVSSRALVALSSAASKAASKAASASGTASAGSTPSASGTAGAGSTPGASSTPSASNVSGSSHVSPTTRSLALTANERRDCPAAAAACVDLTEKITWLQAAGRVTYGPVRMESSPPGAQHATPTGTFRVTGDGGPDSVGTVGHHVSPWAVFLAPGGIAFCEGSLSQSPDGCVDLTMAAARFYSQHLPAGAEAVVFLG